MNVDFAFVCDHAEVGNKISALGIGFDTIFTPSLPCTHQEIHFVAQMRTSVAEAGSKQLELRLIDADGGNVVPAVSGSFEVPATAGGGDGIGRVHVVLQNAIFQQYGMYSLHLVVQGTEIVRIPLRVAEAAAAA